MGFISTMGIDEVIIKVKESNLNAKAKEIVLEILQSFL